MTTLKISVPVYKRNNWGNLEVCGEITVSASDGESLTQDYDRLKLQIDELLQKVNAENQLVLDCRRLADEIETKNSALKTLNVQVECANRQFNRLKNFLGRLGIDATSSQMIVAQEVQQKLRSVAVVGNDDDDDDDERGYEF